MTIICAMHEPGIGTWIGSDGRMCAGMTILTDATPKWAMVKGGAVAVAGQNVVRGALFDRADEVDAAWSATELRKWLVAVYDDLRMEPATGDGKSAWWDVGVILASPTRILSLCGSGGPAEIPPRILHARGSGCDFAEGAAFAMRRTGATGADVVKTSVLAAINGDAGCGGIPFVHLLAAG